LTFWVSGAEELPPCALSEPYVNLSTHTAPIVDRAETGGCESLLDRVEKESLQEGDYEIIKGLIEAFVYPQSTENPPPPSCMLHEVLTEDPGQAVRVKVHSAMISLCRHFSDALFAKRESVEYSLRYER
jgi:hypothetical protein